MAEDKTVRLILGVILILVSLPFFGMGTMMSGFGLGYGMMGGYAGYGLFWPGLIICYLVGIGLLSLGIYLVLNSLKK